MTPCFHHLARAGLLLLAALGAPAQSQPAPARIATPIEIGTSHRLPSKSLREERIVNVVLPASYSKDRTRRYPVLYLIDGGIDQDLLHIAGVVQLGAVWGRSAEAIVVGIETRDRRRELVGPTADPELRKRYPTAGSSAQFRAFVRNEVKPLIERSYRTDGHDAVLGESLAGLFVLETYLAEPAMFDGYAAVDPSLWWDKEALSKAAAAKLGTGQLEHPLFIALAKEQIEEPAGIQRLLAALRGSGLGACLAPRPDLTHATIYQQLSPMAVQFLLPPKEAPAPEYGFAVTCSTSL